MQWQQTQALMKQDSAVTEYRLNVWNLEASWTQQHGTGYTLNVGGADNVLGEISCDPQTPRTVKCVGEALPFPDGCFDTVLVYSVLDHCLNDGNLLLEAKRVLRPSGHLLVMQAVYGFHVWVRQLLGRWKDKNHMRHYFFNQLQTLLHKSGFLIRHRSYNHEFTVEFLDCQAIS